VNPWDWMMIIFVLAFMAALFFAIDNWRD